MTNLIRLAKWLSERGVASRRKSETLIFSGHVKVNHQITTTVTTFVNSKDRIEVDNNLVSSAKETLTIWLYHKPAGLLVTHHDPENRPTIFEALKKKNLGYIISVGRLDLNSEGLILLTNQGAFAHYAEHPSTEWTRTYRIRVFGNLNKKIILELSKKGCTIEGIHYRPFIVHFPPNKENSKNQWLFMTLFEGKNREVRKIMSHAGLTVNRLICTSYGPFSLESLPKGEIKKVSSSFLESFSYLKQLN